jgi:hypothetical protein
MGRGLMDNFPFVDYVFSGEVDYSFPEFLDCIHGGKTVIFLVFSIAAPGDK